MPQLERRAHPVAAQVEVAVAQPQLLPHLTREALDLERRRVGVGEHIRSGDPDLELARRELGVDGLRIPAHDLPGRGDHVLGSQPVGEIVGASRRLGVEHELHEPGAVSQVDEDQPAVIAPPVYPTGDARSRVEPVLEHLAAPRVAVAILTQDWERIGHREPQSRSRQVPAAAISSAMRDRSTSR